MYDILDGKQTLTQTTPALTTCPPSRAVPQACSTSLLTQENLQKIK